MIRITYLSACFMLILPVGMANAAWNVNVEGPDVFGDVKVVAVNQAQSGSALIIQCNQEDQLEIAYIEKAKDVSDDASVPVQIGVQVDRLAPNLLSGSMKKWNENYVGAVLSGRSTENIAAAKSIASAKEKVSIGYRFPSGGKGAIIVDAIRTPALARALIQSCKL